MEETTPIEESKFKKAVKSTVTFAKDNWKPLLGAGIAVGIKVVVACVETRNDNKKTEAYIDALEERTEMQREALGLSSLSDDLEDPRPEDN